nr:autotransporter outer membrane beta-barrel domain-containing protein [Ciceribacter sp. L1K23]
MRVGTYASGEIYHSPAGGPCGFEHVTGASIASGSIPPGVSLFAFSTNPVFKYSGIPTIPGSYTVAINAAWYDDLCLIGGNDVITVNFTVADEAPTAANVVATVAANSADNAITLSLGGGTATSVAVASSPSHGTATASGTSITYTPTAGYSGSDSFTYTATNSGGTSAAATVSITISAPALAISPSGSLSATVGNSFSQAFTASNGTAPYGFAMTGALPDGLSFDAASATLSGTPTEGGTYPLTLRATDALGASTSTVITLAVDISVTTVPITVSAISGVTTTVDLTTGATGGPLTGARLLSLSPPNAGDAVIILGDTAASTGDAAFAAALSSGRYQLRFTANPTFTGTAIATYTLTSASGTSAPSTVTFMVSARPLLNSDADLVGLVEAQARAAVRLAEVQIDTVQDHLRSLRTKPCLENSLQITADDGHGGTAPIDANTGCSNIAGGNLAFWSAGSIMFGDDDASRGGNDSTFKTVNLTAGLDYRITEYLTAGIGLGFAIDEDEIGSSGTTSSNRAASVTVYGLQTLGDGFYVDGLAGVGLLDFTSVRITGTNSAEAEAQRDGHQFFAAFGGGYDWTAGGFTVSPHGRISASHSVLDAMTETGADWENVALSRQTVDTLTASLGLDISYAILLDDAVLTPELSLDFSHSLFDSGDTTATYADSNWPIDYVIPGTTDRRNNAVLGLGITLSSTERASISARYRSAFNGDGVVNQSFRVDLSGRF